MALAATTIFELRTAGNDASAGGFNVGNANFATDLTATSGNTGSPVVSSASYTFVAGDVGAVLYIKAGTNWTAGMYTIASVSAGAATLSAAIGAATLYSNNVPIGLNVVAGCATVASPTAGTWGIDYSQQTAAQISFTDMVIDGTTNTKFTSAGNPVGKNMIGNLINVTSGTGFTVQRVEVISTVTTTATCDKSLGTLSSTGGNGALGGALASIGTLGSIMTAGMFGFGKYNASAYVSTTASTNVTNGCVTGVAGTGLHGYDTTRTRFNTDANRPTFQIGAAVGTATLFATGISLTNMILDGNSQTASRGTSAIGFAQRCKAINCTTSGFAGTSTYGCEATANNTTTGAFNNCTAFYCESHDNVGPGFGTGGTANHCISYSNTGAQGIGFSGFNNLDYCVAYNNAQVGFSFSSSSAGLRIANLIAEANTGAGFAVTAGSTRLVMFNCGSFNNTGGRSTTAGLLIEDINPILGSGSFFTNAAAGDFSLNSTSGAGALARNAGFPTSFPRGLTANAADIGAMQHSGGTTISNSGPGFGRGTMRGVC